MNRADNKKAKELRSLEKMQPEEIDLSDIPELREWDGAVVGKFYRPIKRPLTLRIDADVLAWLKSQGKGYQTRINKILRAAMTSHAANRRRA